MIVKIFYKFLNMQKILYDIKEFIELHWHDDKFRKLLTYETRGRIHRKLHLYE